MARSADALASSLHGLALELRGDWGGGGAAPVRRSAGVDAGGFPAWRGRRGARTRRVERETVGNAHLRSHPCPARDVLAGGGKRNRRFRGCHGLAVAAGICRHGGPTGARLQPRAVWWAHALRSLVCPWLGRFPSIHGLLGTGRRIACGGGARGGGVSDAERGAATPEHPGAGVAPTNPLIAWRAAPEGRWHGGARRCQYRRANGGRADGVRR